MNIVYERCAGIDVHKRNVVVCAITPDVQGQRQKEQRTFSTMMPDLLRMRQWFQSLNVTHVAMESTGSFWKPIFNVLEGHMEVLVVNAQHLKAVPGRKTDLKDAEWIADLLQHGLLRQLCPACVPTGTARTYPVSDQRHRRTFPHDQSLAQDFGRYQYQAFGGRK